jgi:hypothetical protein
MKTDLAQEAMKSTPPVAVAGAAWVFGLTLNDWVAIGTLLYLVLQGAFLVWKWWKEANRKERK